jgi:hypothetical protein
MCHQVDDQSLARHSHKYLQLLCRDTSLSYILLVSRIWRAVSTRTNWHHIANRSWSRGENLNFLDSTIIFLAALKRDARSRMVSLAPTHNVRAIPSVHDDLVTQFFIMGVVTLYTVNSTTSG